MIYDLAVVGAGFAGALVARLAALQGRRVALVERDVHPRFALGESSTPLAALALERLARRYDQPDLEALAAHGRWRRRLPELGCGLKRGFTFYRHQPGQPFRSHGPDARLLVAASPDDDSADCHWRRADVDLALVEQARRAGVAYRDRCAVVGARQLDDRVRLTLRREDADDRLEARYVVDASGAAAAAGDPLGAGRGPVVPFSSRLVYAHFDGVAPFAPAARAAGAVLPDGPYPDDQAAVHHLLDEGWLYALRFDDGVVSAGLLIEGDTPDPPDRPAHLWRRVVGRYPTLAATFADARARPPGLRATARLQRRRHRAAGARWALLPHTFAFFDPMFSTGIAWGLLAVERLTGILTGGNPGAGLARYGRLLAREADQQQALLTAAYMARRDLSLFREVSFLYFACVSYEEIRLRLLDDPETGPDGEGPAWRGFLGAGTAPWASLLPQAPARVSAALDGTAEGRAALSAWVREGIRARNVVGLGDNPTHLYGVDLDLLRTRHDLLGLTREALEARLPRLRGAEPDEGG